jgi:hypothetical protein
VSPSRSPVGCAKSVALRVGGFRASDRIYAASRWRKLPFRTKARLRMFACVMCGRPAGTLDLDACGSVGAAPRSAQVGVCAAGSAGAAWAGARRARVWPPGGRHADQHRARVRGRRRSLDRVGPAPRRGVLDAAAARARGLGRSGVPTRRRTEVRASAVARLLGSACRCLLIRLSAAPQLEGGEPHGSPGRGRRRRR